MIVKHELASDRFLETLRKSKSKWQNDKEFAKIVEKMEKGKNLKKKEFSRVLWVFWEIGHCNL
jgi:hypothetical protein